MNALSGKNIVLGVTGGIAAYKSAALVSLLKKQQANIRVVMTEHASKFVSPLTFETLSGNRVYLHQFDEERSFEIDHVSLSKWADMVVVAPCTANMMAKLASGIADDLLSTSLIAAKCPVLLAPAMNTNMYEHPATQQNMATLKQRGVLFIDGKVGLLACGDTGKGRMAEPEEILSCLNDFFSVSQDMHGLKVIVTAGPTREYLDPVRFISNPSTGKMGYALAAECAKRGAAVTLVSGPVNLAPPQGVKLVSVETADQMKDAVLAEYEACDFVFKSAAVGDFRPLSASAVKIKKDPTEPVTFAFEQNTDILKLLGAQKTHQFLCGFAAETNDIFANAQKKLTEKNLDMIFVNDVTGENTGFAVDSNGGCILQRNGEKIPVPVCSKAEVAKILVNTALAQRASRL